VNRALRARTLGALLLSPIALGACSAGQVTQTATQDRDKAGPMADVANITLRSVLLEYPSGASYDEGDDAELTAAIVNTADEADTLLSIESDAFEEVRVLGGDVDAVSQPSGEAGGDIGLEIGRDETIFLGEDGPTVLLENLTEELTPGESIELTMTFELAGEITVRAQVDNPEEALERGEAFDFHQEETGEGEAGEGSDDREAATGAGSESEGD
jgi:copper(I)-binding protein